MQSWKYIRKRKQKRKQGGKDVGCVEDVEHPELPELPDNKYLKDKRKIIINNVSGICS